MPRTTWWMSAARRTGPAARPPAGRRACHVRIEGAAEAARRGRSRWAERVGAALWHRGPLLGGAVVLAAAFASATFASARPQTPPNSAAPSARTSPELPRESARRLLADMFGEAAVELVAATGGSADIELAVMVCQRSVELAPDDPDLWRLLLQLADIAGQRDVAVKALDQIVRLDPADEVVRLRRIVEAIESLDTAEARIAAYQRLLTPEKVAQLGPATASRLALDLALLLGRTGDSKGYANWLAEAVAIDPFNPAAVSELAGFFQASATDPAAVAELLVARCAADPSNLDAIEQLGRFLLDEGAFIGASRMLNLVVEQRGGGRFANPELVNALALALWGAGQPDEALRLIDIRQREEDDALRRRIVALGLAVHETGTLDEATFTAAAAGLPAPSALELERLTTSAPLTRERVAELLRVATAPLPPDLAATRAAILQTQRSPEAPGAAVALSRSLRGVLDSVRLVLRNDPSKAPVVASTLESAAWLLLFLGNDLPASRDALTLAASAGVAPPATSGMLPGWTRIYEGRLEDAEVVLAPCAESDARCALGLAVAQLRRGDRAAAAAGLLRAARELGGTVGGLWALETLLAELGTRAPLERHVPEIEAMVAGLPPSFDRLLIDPAREIVVTVTPTQALFGTGERIEAEVQISNRSALTLALGPGAPLRPTIAIPLSITTFGLQNSATELPMPLMVDIARSLRLAPRETATMRVNLSRVPAIPGRTLGSICRELALVGTRAAITGRAVLNPAPALQSGRQNRLEAGPLGTSSPPLDFRIDGLPADDVWRAKAQADVATMDAPDDLMTLLALVRRAALVDEAKLNEMLPDQRAMVVAALEEQSAAIDNAVPQLDATGQALVAMLMQPDRPHLQGAERRLRQSDDPDVRLAVLLTLVSHADDPILDETRRGDDLRLRAVADLIGERLERRAAARDR